MSPSGYTYNRITIIKTCEVANMKATLSDEERKKLAEEFIKKTDSKIKKSEKHTWMIRDYDRLKNKQE